MGSHRSSPQGSRGCLGGEQGNANILYVVFDLVKLLIRNCSGIGHPG